MLNCQMQAYYEDNIKLYEALVCSGASDTEEEKSKKRKMIIDMLRTVV